MKQILKKLIYSLAEYNYHFLIFLILYRQVLIFPKMSTNQCLNSSQSHFSKFIMDDRADKTRSTENFSKLCQNCRLIKDELEAEIFTLKDKSHQSFMQVIQVQQLHQEEMELMKSQHQDQITALREEITKLQAEVSKNKDDLVIMQKNSKHHICYFEQPSFLIQNIEMIECNEENQKKSKLDESSFDQFNEIVESKSSNLNAQFLKPKSGQIKQFSNNTDTEDKIQRLNLKILQLQSEVQSLWQTNQQLKKQCVKLQTNQKSIKNNYDSLYKESKFMADHIRALANDKFKLQRKVKQLQKEIRQLKRQGLKQSAIFDDKQSMMSIKINGSDIFGSQDFDNVRNSLENSIQQKDKFDHKHIIPQAFQGLNNVNSAQKNKPLQNAMIKSDMFTTHNNQLEARKSMPNYKKVSHISPSFKKISSSKIPQKQSQFLKIENQVVKQSDKSDFMDQIRKQIQLKASLKKSGGPFNHHESQKPSLFHDNFKKRSSAQ